MTGDDQSLAFKIGEGRSSLTFALNMFECTMNPAHLSSKGLEKCNCCIWLAHPQLSTTMVFKTLSSSSNQKLTGKFNTQQ